MQYRVPQFIEVEDKIIGPLTLKQFIYLAGGAGVAIVLWFLLPWFIAVILAAPIVILAVALAFYKVNNRPFIAALEAMFNHFTNSKLYLWKRKEARTKQEAVQKVAQETEGVPAPKLTHSKLKDIAWSLDVQESIYAGQNRR